jgi:PKD repeat protein
MAEQEAAPPAKPKSWYKALLGTIGGVISGAAVMYVTPLVDKVVKPPKPVANFKCEIDGAVARFQNLSRNGQGHWDFGDGTPLERTSPEHQYVDHTYTRPGEYTVKLTLHNALGDEDERSAPVHIDAPATPAAPKIVSLEAVPVSAGSYAPATFRLVSKVQNAQLTVLDFGDERVCEVVTEHPDARDQLVTFPKPGSYRVKLAAFNGALNEQRIQTVTVAEAPANSLTAMLTVTDEATRQETKTHPAVFSAAYPTDSRPPTVPIDCEVRARPGHDIADLAFKTTDGQEIRLGSQTELGLDAAALGIAGARNLRLQMSADKQAVRLTGELVDDPNNKTAPPPSLMLSVTLTVQKMAPVTQTYPVATTLSLPAANGFTSGTLALPAVPKDWVNCQRRFQLEVLDAGKKVFEDSQLQHSALVTLQGRKFILTTTRTEEQVRIDLMEAPTATQ